MKLKLDDDGHVVLQDGKPVYVQDDGKEVAFDAPGTVATISRLNGEAKGHRERAENAEKALKQFEGIEDPAAAMKALDTIKNLDHKKLVDAGEVEKVKAEAIKAIEDKYSPILKERDSLQAELYNERIGGAFSRSKFISENMLIPPDMVQARFGDAFKIEDGKTVAYDKSGNKIFSRSNPGETAGFDEAIEILVDHYPHKDHILKGSGAYGGGTTSQNGGGGRRRISRAEFGNMSPDEQMKASAAAKKGEIELAD